VTTPFHLRFTNSQTRRHAGGTFRGEFDMKHATSQALFSASVFTSCLLLCGQYAGAQDAPAQDASAQDAPAQDAPAADEAAAPAGTGALEEVFVTAQKRREPLQRVPIAATAFTAETLETRFIKDFTDVSAALPNASLEAEGISNYASSFYIRGQGVLNRGPFVDPAVAVIIDGVTEGRVATTLTDMLDIEAIEVLRGPQGTLQGRNSTGGAILVRHYKPDPGGFDGSAGLLVGNEGRYDVSAMLNIPIVSDKAAFRIAAKGMESDGFYENTFSGDNVTGQRRVSVLPSFLWKGEAWDLTLRGNYQKYSDEAATLVPRYTCRVDPRLVPNTAVDPTQPQNDTYVNSIATRFGGDAALQYCAHEPSSDSYTVNQDRPRGEVADLDVLGGSLEFNYNFANAGTLTYVFGYQDNEETSGVDVDGTFTSLNWNEEHTNHYQSSHELRFASEFSEAFDFVAGLLYLDQQYGLTRQTFVDTTPVALTPMLATLNTSSSQKNQQYGAFAQVNWHLTDALTLVTGARYTKDEKDFLICGSSPVVCPGRYQANSDEWSDTSPRVGVNYEVNDDTFLYAYWASGFRAGGFNGEAGSAAAAGPFDPEEVDTYEIGSKVDFFNDTLRVNFAAFYSEAANLQRQLARAAPSGVAEIVTQNAAEAEFKGAELEATAVPVDGLTLTASIGWLDAEYTDYCTDLNGAGPNDPSLVNCAPAIAVTGGVIQPVDLTGLPIARTPEWTTRLGAQYTFPVGEANSLTLAGEWAFSDEELTLDGGAPVGTTLGITNFDGGRVDPMRDATNIFNASVTWRGSDDRYTVSAYGKNLTEEVYFRRLSFAAPTLSFGTLGNPREYGLQLNYNFAD
jgi:iron complex outermembrane receptor protein